MVKLRLTRDVRHMHAGETYTGKGVHDMPKDHADAILEDWQGLWVEVEPTHQPDTKTSDSAHPDGTDGDTEQSTPDEELRAFLDGSINGDILPALRAGEYADSLAQLEDIERSKDARTTVLDKLDSLQGE